VLTQFLVRQAAQPLSFHIPLLPSHLPLRLLPLFSYHLLLGEPFHLELLLEVLCFVLLL
jgi:hypothetical protein